MALFFCVGSEQSSHRQKQKIIGNNLKTRGEHLFLFWYSGRENSEVFTKASFPEKGEGRSYPIWRTEGSLPRSSAPLPPVCKRKKKSPATVEKYLREVQCFAAWLAESGLEVDKEAVAAYKEELLNKGFCPATVNGQADGPGPACSAFWAGKAAR